MKTKNCLKRMTEMANKKFKLLIFTTLVNANFIDSNNHADVYLHKLGKKEVNERNIKIAVVEISSQTSLKKIDGIIYELSKPNTIFDGVIFLPGSYSNFLYKKTPVMHLQDDIKNIKIPKICYVHAPLHFISYYIISGCDEIWGFQCGQYQRPENEISFIKGTEPGDKYFEISKIYQAGKHKVAASDGIELSDENRLYLENLVKMSLIERLNTISTNRNIGNNEINQWLAKGSWITASQALELKLIDNIGSYIAAKRKIVETIKQSKNLPENTKVVEIYIDTRKEKRERQKNKNL